VRARTCQFVSTIHDIEARDIPPCRVTLQIFALAFKQASSDLLTGEMVLAWVVDVFSCSDGDVWVHELGIFLDKFDPFSVFGHGNWAAPELVNCIVAGICFPLQNACVGVVRLLDLANNNRLEFPTRGLQVEVSLGKIVSYVSYGVEGRWSYLMQIVLLV
jgi:hypothetical protein